MEVKQKPKGRPRVYLLNALIVPFPTAERSASFRVNRVKLESVKYWLRQYEREEGRPIVSAIGHPATASLLSQALEREVAVNRISVQFFEGDEGFAFVLKRRLGEGEVLTQLSESDVDVYHITRLI